MYMGIFILICLASFIGYVMGSDRAYRQGWNDCKEANNFLYTYDDYMTKLDIESRHEPEFPQEMMN